MYKLAYSIFKLGSSSGGVAIDPDAQLVIDRMTGLSSLEETAINTFVIAEKDDGNYTLYDEFFCHSLGAVNGLIGFKSKTATINGGVTFDVNGATFNGTTGYLDTDFSPANDGVNYVADDAFFSSFLRKLPIPASDGAMVGVDDGANLAVLRAFTTSINNWTGKALNHASLTNPVIAVSDNQLLSMGNTSGLPTRATAFVDGVSYGNTNRQVQGVPASNVFIGAQNNNGTAISYSGSTVSSFAIGGGNGLDHAAHTVNIKIFLATLQSGYAVTDIDAADAILNTGVTDSTEAQAISDFIVAEKSDGNYALYDEFFLLSLGATNSLNGFKGTKGTANGGITWDVNGATFNGTTGYIDTNWTPSVDGVNLTQDDALLGFFVKDKITGATAKSYMGSIGNVSNENLFMRIANGTNMGISVNSATVNSGGGGDVSIGDNKLWASTRTANSFHTLYKDGASQGTRSSTSVGLSDEPLAIGALNNQGVISEFLNVTMSTAIVGAAIGFDHATHNTNVRQLLTDLGVVLP